MLEGGTEKISEISIRNESLENENQVLKQDLDASIKTNKNISDKLSQQKVKCVRLDERVQQLENIITQSKNGESRSVE